MSVKRTYIGSDERYFPDLGVLVAPGDENEFDVAPESPLLVTAADAKKAAEVWRPARDRVLAAREAAAVPEPAAELEPTPDVPAEPDAEEK